MNLAMDGSDYNGVHSDGIAKRQGLGGLVNGILGGGQSSTSQNTDPLGLGGLTSVLGSILPLPSSSSSSHSTTSLISTTSSSSSKISSTFSSTSTSLTSSLPSSTPSPTPTPTSTSSHTTSTSISSSPSSTLVFTSSSGGGIITVTSIQVAAQTSSAAATPAGAKSFFQNKPLEGTVFALVGIVGAVILVGLLTLALRKKRKNRLYEDAIRWPDADPPPPDLLGSQIEKGAGSVVRRNSTEKRRRGSDSSNGHGYGSDGSSSAHGAIPPGIPGYTAYRPGGYGPPATPPPSVPGYMPQQQIGYTRGQANQAYGRELPNPHAPQYNVPYGQDNSLYSVPYVQGVNRSPTTTRLPNPVYDPMRSPAPYLNSPSPPRLPVPEFNVVSPTPPGPPSNLQKTLPRLEIEEANAEYQHPESQRVSPTSPGGIRSSLLSPTLTSEEAYSGISPATARRRASSHSKELNPNMPGLPTPPQLPDSFGEEMFATKSEQDERRILKVANE